MEGLNKSGADPETLLMGGCGRQIMRDNVEAESPEDYFRKSITVPFLYCMLNEMKTRFTDLIRA
jgi:hypothetical protein